MNVIIDLIQKVIQADTRPLCIDLLTHTDSELGIPKKHGFVVKQWKDGSFLMPHRSRPCWPHWGRGACAIRRVVSTPALHWEKLPSTWCQHLGQAHTQAYAIPTSTCEISPLNKIVFHLLHIWCKGCILHSFWYVCYTNINIYDSPTTASSSGEETEENMLKSVLFCQCVYSTALPLSRQQQQSTK